jgi:hypothetical protein
LGRYLVWVSVRRYGRDDLELGLRVDRGSQQVEAEEHEGG